MCSKIFVKIHAVLRKLHMIKHMTTLTISHCPYVKKDVKLSKRCQVVNKMSNVKKSNTWTMEEVHKKNKLT